MKGKLELDYIIFAFETAQSFYVRLFGDFLHVHFMIRTVFLLLMVWFIIAVCLKIFKYLIGPIFVLAFYHIFFRLHNYLFVETPAEWIYIRYYSKDLPTLEGAYLRLTDKAKKKRELLGELDYGMSIVKLRNAERKISYFLLSLSTLWIVAFGLYAEFFPPPSALLDNSTSVNGHAVGPDLGQYAPGYREEHVNENEINEGNIGGGHNVYQPGTINPAEWDAANIVLMLNETGRSGAWLRTGPGISGFIVTQVLWGDVVLDYMGFYVPDDYVTGLYWIRVRTPEGNTGYLASSLVEVYR